MKARLQKGKVVWEGFSWFIAGFVYSLSLMILAGIAGAGFQIEWLGATFAILALAAPFAMAVWRVRWEIRRQRHLGLDQVPRRLSDPVLGDLIYDGSSWEGKVFLGTDEVELSFASEGLPDPILLQRARSIVQNATGFLQRLEAFKEEQLKSEPHLAEYAEEIRGLKVFSLCFYAPVEPESGFMSYSSKLENERTWHSDLEGGNPVGLGFDT